MPHAYITELTSVGRDSRGNNVSAALLHDYVRSQRIPIGPISVETAPFLETTNMLRVIATADMHLASGFSRLGNPVLASDNDMFIKANSTEYFTIVPGLTVAIKMVDTTIPFTAPRPQGAAIVPTAPEVQISKPQKSWGEKILSFFNSN